MSFMANYKTGDKYNFAKWICNDYFEHIDGMNIDNWNLTELTRVKF